MRLCMRLCAVATLVFGALLLLYRGWPWPLRAPVVTLPPPQGRDLPLIFVGGMHRSGTTLMRVMLDAHNLVRCGHETRVTALFLDLHKDILSTTEGQKLGEAGVTKTVFDNAMAAFCLQIIVGHGEPAPRLCTKDPYVLQHAVYVQELFPNAKFVFMVRDGRAITYSAISHADHTKMIGLKKYNTSSPRECMEMWNTEVQLIYEQCQALGPARCLYVHYESLVLAPEQTMRAVLDWLDLPWDEAVLHHEQHLETSHGKALSYMERFSVQMVHRPVNLDALDKWVGHFPPDLVDDMAEVAPMLATLGYDPHANPPDYRKLTDLNLPSNTR